MGWLRIWSARTVPKQTYERRQRIDFASGQHELGPETRKILWLWQQDNSAKEKYVARLHPQSRYYYAWQHSVQLSQNLRVSYFSHMIAGAKEVDKYWQFPHSDCRNTMISCFLQICGLIAPSGGHKLHICDTSLGSRRVHPDIRCSLLHLVNYFCHYAYN